MPAPLRKSSQAIRQGPTVKSSGISRRWPVERSATAGTLNQLRPHRASVLPRKSPTKGLGLSGAPSGHPASGPPAASTASQGYSHTTEPSAAEDYAVAKPGNTPSPTRAHCRTGPQTVPHRNSKPWNRPSSLCATGTFQAHAKKDAPGRLVPTPGKPKRCGRHSPVTTAKGLTSFNREPSRRLLPPPRRQGRRPQAPGSACNVPVRRGPDRLSPYRAPTLLRRPAGLLTGQTRSTNPSRATRIPQPTPPLRGALSRPLSQPPRRRDPGC